MTIALDDVHWSSGKRIIIKGVTFQARPGHMVGLIGPNGSGKSSLLRLICRLRRSAAGVITLDGQALATFDRRRLAQRMALVEQQVSTDTPITVLDAVRLGRVPHRGALSPWSSADDTAVEAALNQVNLLPHAHSSWHTLSGGERQRTQIARALAQSPSELLLDEPTNHLDVRHQLDLLSLISSLPTTVIVAIHDLNMAARFCKELILLCGGAIVASGRADIVLTQENIKSVFGVDAEIERCPRAGHLRIHFA
jgi:iron complex transport system ATP-binding protein